MKAFLILFFLLLASEGVLLADVGPERFFVHFDRPVYSAGDILWYKVYALEKGADSLRSKVVHVELVGADGSAIVSQKLKLEDGTAHGDMALPLDLKEGHYQFRAYTQWALNYGERFIFKKWVPVLSDWEGTARKPGQAGLLELPHTAIGEKLLNEGGLQFAFSFSQENYQNREGVELGLEVTDLHGSPVEGDFSLAVTEAAMLPWSDSLHIVHYRSHYPKESPEKPVPGEAGFPMEENLGIAVQLTDPKAGQNINSYMISIFMANNHRFVRAAAKMGAVAVDLPDFYGEEVLQFHNLFPANHWAPEATYSGKVFDFEKPLPPPLQRTAAIESYLYFHAFRQKINEIFQTLNFAEIPIQPEDMPKFEPDQTFSMKDYQLLEDLEDFFKRVVFKTRIKQEGGKPTVRLYNPDILKHFIAHPWYLVDGLLTADEPLVLAIPLGQIERVSLLLSKDNIYTYFEPFMRRNGIVAISTKERALRPKIMAQPNILALQGYHQAKNFIEAVQLAQQSPEAPDFRPLVHWEPTIRTGADGKAKVRFMGNDVAGKLKINVQGIGKSGEVGVGETVFEVVF